MNQRGQTCHSTTTHECLENEHLRVWWNSGKCNSGGEAALKHRKRQKGQERRLQIKVFHLISSETLCVHLETLGGLTSNRQMLKMAEEGRGEKRENVLYRLG